MKMKAFRLCQLPLPEQYSNSYISRTTDEDFEIFLKIFAELLRELSNFWLKKETGLPKDFHLVPLCVIL